MAIQLRARKRMPAEQEVMFWQLHQLDLRHLSDFMMPNVISGKLLIHNLYHFPLGWGIDAGCGLYLGGLSVQAESLQEALGKWAECQQRTRQTLCGKHGALRCSGVMNSNLKYF